MAGEEEGLEVGQEADGDAFAEEGVGDGFEFALLPSEKDGFAGVVGELDGTGFGGVEVLGRELLTVDEGQGEAVGDGTAELLHEVEGEAGAAGAEFVEKADLRVEADGFAGTPAVVGEKSVEEGE